jgi:ABC-type sugar transport system permease subunit
VTGRLGAANGADGALVRARLAPNQAIPKPATPPGSASSDRTPATTATSSGSRSGRMKPVNQKAWLLVLPVVLCVAFSAILPLMTVVNYSVQDIISPERRVFVGTEWFKAVMRDDDLQGALLRQISFSLAVLAVEIPLGIALALSMPAKGWQASAVLVLVAISLLIPWNVVGTIWQIYGRTDIGLLGAALASSASTTATPATRRMRG